MKDERFFTKQIIFNKKLLHKQPLLGFTVIEALLVLSVLFILTGLATVNLFKFQHKSQLSSTVASFLADYKEQQIKAMVGDTNGTATPSAYGVHLETGSYTLFRNTYGTENFTVNLPSGTKFSSTTFANSQVLFATGSGEVSTVSNTITIKDTGDGTQKVITINRYGIVTGVN